MLVVLATWVALWLACLGVGAAIYGGAFRWLRAVPSIEQLVWLGVATLLLVLQLASFACAVRPWMLFVFGAGSLLGWPLLWRMRARPSLVSVVVIAIVLVLVANSALGPIDWYDTVSTHLQQAKWSNAFAILPGLGNLNPKLGFDQAHHLLAAALDGGALSHRSAHVAVAFLLATLLVEWLRALIEPSDDIEKAFCALTLPFVLHKTFTNELPSLSGDLAMGIVCLAALRQLLRVGVALQTRRRVAQSLLVVGALAGALFAIKFSALPVLVAFGLLCAWHRPPRIVILLPLLLVLATCARRVVLTGWPLFPIPLVDFHLPWSVPRAETLSQYRWIESWARMPHHLPADALDHGFFHWFVPWLEAFQKTRECAVAIFAGIALVARARLGRAHTTTIATMTAVSCVAYWFIGAPDIRFGGVFLWSVLALSLAPLFARAGLLLLLTSTLLTWWNDGFAFHLHTNTLTPMADHRTEPRSFQNRDSTPFVVNVPTEGDLCGDAQLPCSPYFSTQQMRDPRSLARGYRP